MSESLCWRIKTRLQWTGWLQYIPTLFVTLLSFLLSYLAWLLAIDVLFYPLASLGCLSALATAFDLCTVKCGLRPREPYPTRCDGLDAFDLMRGRRSCRSFQTRCLRDADLGELMDCVRQETATSKLLGTCPIRLEYIAASLTVWPVVGAHEFLVAIAPKEYSRGAVIDVGRCLQKVVLHAARMGLATCWIGPGADHRSVIRHLGERFDPRSDHIICVCAIGYASSYMPTFVRVMCRMTHRRMPLSDLFFADSSFQTPLDVWAHPFSRYGRCYEGCQWSPSSFNAQPVRCVGAESGRRFDFYAATPSRFYVPVALGIWLANWETGCEALGIPGHFEVLAPEKRTLSDVKSLGGDSPIYDMSWLADAL